MKVTALSGFVAGVIFGLGLIISGMTDPAKVKGFLDIFGQWDPSLGLVMAGAILVAFLPFRFAARRSKGLLGEPISLPQNQAIDLKLIGGSAVFGIGWGLSGYCPGPAIASLLTGGLAPLIFTLGMLAGMSVHHLLDKSNNAD